MLLLALFLVMLGAFGERAGRPEFLLFLGSWGMLAGSFIHVVTDKLAMSAPLSHGFSSYPAELGESRRQRKNPIIPLFMSQLCAISVVYIISGGSAEGGMSGVIRSALPFTLAFLFVIVILVLIWIRNTDLLFSSVITQLEGISAKDKNLCSRVGIGSVDELASISFMVNDLCAGLSASMADISLIHGELAAMDARLFEGIRASNAAA